jgi:hypothetical protein
MEPYLGTVRSGAVVVPPEAGFVEGQQVQILPAGFSPEEAFLLQEMTPRARALPDDLAINHDYYLHGLPKQRPRVGRWIRPDCVAKELTEQESAEYTDSLLRLAADTRNLSADLSSNHDHYLHGLRKR